MKLLSFGEVLWDVYPDEEILGGAPLNLAAHAAQCGADAWLLSAVGADKLGEKAIKQISSFGVHTEFISALSDKETGKCLVTLDENAIPHYRLLEDVAYDFIPLSPALSEACFDVLAFGTLALRSEHNKKAIRTVIDSEICKEIYADVNIRPPFYSEESLRICLENATIVKISDEELPTVCQLILQDTFTLEDAAIAFSEQFPQIKLLLLTKGANGSVCFDCRKKEFYSCPAEKTEVVSTVGAGDSFGGAFLAQYFSGTPILECLSFASKISAFVCSRKEAVPEYKHKKN
ncbi:MAG: carbohydrate kinase [Ruminococcaceae bacterium]|nr:carbohydrate kinase [Oscillospiraceae bacterium]